MSNAFSKLQSWRKETKQPPKNFGGPIFVVAATLLIFILSQLIAAIVVGLVYSVSHPHANAPAFMDQSAQAQFLYVLIAEGLAVWFVLRIIKNRGLRLPQIGLGRLPQWNDAVKAVLGFGAFYGLLIVVGIVLSLVFPDIDKNQTQDVGFNNLDTSLDHAIALVALVVLPPLGEEILVRGYLYSGLRSYWKFLPAMLVTSVLFGIAHLQTGSGAALLWTAGIDTFILSIILVYLREKTGALYAGMLVHALNNLIAFGIHFH